MEVVWADRLPANSLQVRQPAGKHVAWQKRFDYGRAKPVKKLLRIHYTHHFWREIFFLRAFDLHLRALLPLRILGPGIP